MTSTGPMHEMSCRKWRVFGVAVLAAIALVAAACGSSSNAGDDASSATTSGQVDTPTDPHASMSAEQHTAANDDAATNNVVPGSATGDTPCELSGPPASPGQTAGEHGERGLMRQVPLDYAARLQLQQQQEQARAAAARYPTVADALAAGYTKSTPYVTCIGAHYTNVALVVRFDPAAPSELLYDGTEPDSRIVGLSYLVLNPGGPPEGFAGANDVWHQHNANGGLCLQGGVVVGGEGTSEEDCAALGGRKQELKDIWMMHDWVVPGFECTWGVFAGECPELGGDTGASLWSGEPAVSP